MGQRSTSFNLFDILKVLFMSLFPKLSKSLGIQFFSKDQSEFYRSLVHDTMLYRQKESIVRPDMIHLLMESRQDLLNNDQENNITCDGFSTAEDVSNEQLKGKKRMWTDEYLTAQCFLFFVAGFETSATLLCVTVHELAENQYIQARLLEEVDETRRLLDGKPLTYEALQKMKYMDMVISG